MPGADTSYVSELMMHALELSTRPAPRATSRTTKFELATPGNSAHCEGYSHAQSPGPALILARIMRASHPSETSAEVLPWSLRSLAGTEGSWSGSWAVPGVWPGAL